MVQRHVQRPLNKRPVSDLYPHEASMSTHCPQRIFLHLQQLSKISHPSYGVPPPATSLYPALSRSSTAPPINCTTRSPSELRRTPQPPLNRSRSTTFKRLQSLSVSFSSYHLVASRPSFRTRFGSLQTTERSHSCQARSEGSSGVSSSFSLCFYHQPIDKICPPVEPMASLTVEVPLSDEAQADPIYSVATVIEAMVDIKILNSNIISLNKGRSVSSSDPTRTLADTSPGEEYPSYPCTAHISRSCTPTMRQSNLEGFSTDLQLQVLALAQERVHPSRQSIMLRVVHYDRKALLSKALQSLPLFNI